MKKPVIAVLGATGVVGREIIKVIDELKIPFEEIKFLSSAKSAGTKINFQNKQYTVLEATPEVFDGVNIVLASAGSTTSQKFAPEIIKRGGVIIDNSSAFRMENEVPLVIVGANENDIKNHKGIIANPNCSTSQLMLVLKPLLELANIKKLIVSTYQSVSGAGLAAINELTANTKASLNSENYNNVCFKKPISFNVIPQIDSFVENGYTKEEMKVVNETKKILHLDNKVKISCTAVRVPVYRGHSEAVDIEFDKSVSPEKVRKVLADAFGIIVIDNPQNYEYPTTRDADGKNPVFVGRIRNNLAFDNGISLWCVADNLLIGAALNTVRIAQKVIEYQVF